MIRYDSNVTLHSDLLTWLDCGRFLGVFLIALTSSIAWIKSECFLRIFCFPDCVSALPSGLRETISKRKTLGRLGYSTASRPIQSRVPQLTTAIMVDSRLIWFAKVDFCINPWIRAGADGGTKSRCFRADWIRGTRLTMYAFGVHVWYGRGKSKLLIEDVTLVGRKKFPDCVYQQQQRHSF